MIFTAAMTTTQFRGTLFLAGLGVILLTVVVLFVLSIIAQRRYNTDTLPEMNLGGSDDESGEEVSSEESLFHIEDDDSLPPLEMEGDVEAESLLRETRAAQAEQAVSPEERGLKNPFKRKK